MPAFDPLLRLPERAWVGTPGSPDFPADTDAARWWDGALRWWDGVLPCAVVDVILELMASLEVE